MNRLKPNTPRDRRWQVTLALALMLGSVGFVLSLSLDTKHPRDRLVDTIVLVLTGMTIGSLLGYVICLVIYKRFRWFDATISLFVPVVIFYSFVVFKSGDRPNSRLLQIVALTMVAFLVTRFLRLSRTQVPPESGLPNE